MATFAAHDGAVILGVGPTPLDAINDALTALEHAGAPRADNGDGLMTDRMTVDLADLVEAGRCDAFRTLIAARPDGNDGVIGTVDEDA